MLRSGRVSDFHVGVAHPPARCAHHPSCASDSLIGHGAVLIIDVSAILDGDTLHVFAVNRSVDRAAPVRIELPGASLGALVGAELITGSGPKSANAFDAMPQVVPEVFDDVRLEEGSARIDLPPLSFAAASLRLV